MIKKVLIANRGEIAVRVIRACQDLGIQTVAVYSTADAESLHVLNADEAVCIGKPPSTESYLKIAHILAAAEITGADAIHPGYGYLSENANFASIAESCGLTFIGPSHQTIALLGDKSKAKEIAKKVKAPIIPGSDGVINDVDEALVVAKKLGFPIFIKATLGGGGKGIRIAYIEEEFQRQFMAARSEAESSFNCPDVYLEKMIVNPRHVEVQVLGDKFGNYVYLGERDCTIQRRRQKLIEETPSPRVDASLRKKLGEAAVKIVKAAGYHTVGTVEFLLDDKNHFYFMEVNTRIQVEHTITEEVTGIDLVKEQIKAAQGEKLTLKQSDIEMKGHVFQFRINAENPKANFAPCAGKLEYFVAPGGPDVRIDTAAYAGYSIPPYYDSMFAKLIVRGKDRADAVIKARRALREFHIGGIESTVGFHLYMLNNERFLHGDYPITYIDTLIEEGCDFTL
jgi:acetyl-CoA carboxylase biotin carboxylase subunit